MSDNEYLRLMNKLRKTADIETRQVYIGVLRSYTGMYNKYKEELSKVKPGSIKEAWIKTQMKALGTSMAQISEKQELALTGAMNRVIRESLELNESYFNGIAKNAGLPEDIFTGMFTSTNTKILKELLAGEMYRDGGTLSERIWKKDQDFSFRVESILSQGISGKKGYYDIAKELEEFVNPSASKNGRYVPGKGTIDYNAYRLANTMVTHSYQTALARVNDMNPFIDGIEWVGGHNANSCQLCKDRNGKVYAANRKRGIKFTTEPVPLDHPNGFCKNVPYIRDKPEDIGTELRNWLEGEGNPKLDKWYDKYGKQYEGAAGLKAAVKEKPKTKKTIRDDAWYDKQFQGIKDAIPNKYWKELKGYIKKSPEFVQDYFAKGSKVFRYDGVKEDNAYYSPRTLGITMSFKGEGERAASVFFHEFGHLMDHRLGTKVDGNYLAVKYKESLWKLLNEDLEDNIRSRVPESVLKSGNEKAIQNIGKNKLKQELRGDKSDFLAGISDITGGLTLKEIEGRWGHSKEYWIRRDQKLEVVSEAIANLNEALVVPETREYMKKHYPKALAEYEKIIKEMTKKL